MIIQIVYHKYRQGSKNKSDEATREKVDEK